MELSDVLTEETLAATGGQTMPMALTIAGSDCGGGAGIQADARMMRSLGVHACTVITALTAQNTRGVQALQPVSGDMLDAQLRSVLGDFPLGAIKTGLIPSREAVITIAQALREHGGMPLIVDPVLASSSGREFLDEEGVQALLTELMPRATLITPNLGELSRLTGMPTSNLDLARAAGLELILRTGASVLAKGGHALGNSCDDLLLLADGSELLLRGPRIRTPNTHGTGCALSAGIAACLALDLALPDAVETARRRLREALSCHAQESWGGAGPAMP